MLIINFKTYKEGTGSRALKLARKIDKIASEFRTKVAIAVQPTDIRDIRDNIDIPIFAQHMDAITFGSNNGYILPEALKEAGANGVFINHSEHRLSAHRLDLKAIEKTIRIANKLRLMNIVFAKNVTEARNIAQKDPDFIAIEPPELIGGVRSVTQVKPELIAKAVNYIGDILLVGAGVHSKTDVMTSLRLGAAGVLVSSAVVKSETPGKVLRELLRGF